jgi:prepilin-type N-terminal cleavage/methylation domain-containing protein
MRQHAGFTLIELLVVCSILAAVSYVAWGAYVNVDRQAEDELAHAQLLQLATALKRFHEDTGYWPGEGPFRVAGEGCDVSDGSGINPELAVNHDFLENMTSGNLQDQANSWLTSPANMTLLFDPPDLCAVHPLAYLGAWNPATHRGWHGPYLPLANRHWVDVWLMLGEAPPSGHTRLINVPAFGAGPKFAPTGTGDVTCLSGMDGCFLGWRSRPKPVQGAFADGNGDGSDDTTGYDPGKHEFARHARPFIFLRNPARVVYWGADGRYGGTFSDNPCLPDSTDPQGKDDVVICL